MEFYLEGFRMDFSLVMPEEKSFLVDLVVALMGMGIFLGCELTLHLFISVKTLNFTD